MTTLLRRLEALEAAKASADSSKPRPPSGAVLLLRAIFDAMREPTAYGFREHPEEAAELYRRFKAGTATDADRALLAGLPDFGIDPLELLRELVEVRRLFD